MKNILIEVPPHQWALQQLQALPEISVQLIEPREPPEYSGDMLRDKRIYFGSCPPREMPSLELVQISSVGYSQLYGLELAERGVRACNARGVFDPTIAEWNIAMMINLLRDVRGMIRNGEHGIWERAPRFQRELRGLTVGIWGYGGIGRATAQLAKAFGMRVLVLSRGGVAPREDTYAVEGIGDPAGVLPDRVFTSGQEIEFLSTLDFLILAMPQTPSTTGSIGENELKALPSHAFVLNPARGPLIEEEALLNALRTGTIAGAALDTHYYYPMPADHPLWRFPNVIMTPHISGSDSSPHYNERVWDVFIQNVQRYLAGEPLLNELTAAQLQGE